MNCAKRAEPIVSVSDLDSCWSDDPRRPIRWGPHPPREGEYSGGHVLVRCTVPPNVLLHSSAVVAVHCLSDWRARRTGPFATARGDKKCGGDAACCQITVVTCLDSPPSTSWMMICRRMLLILCSSTTRNLSETALLGVDERTPIYNFHGRYAGIISSPPKMAAVIMISLTGRRRFDSSHRQTVAEDYFAPVRAAKYCDEHVCLSVCLLA